MDRSSWCRQLEKRQKGSLSKLVQVHRRSLGKGGGPSLAEWPGRQKNLRMWDSPSQQVRRMASFRPTSVGNGLLGFCLWAVFSLSMQMSLGSLCHHAPPCSQAPSPSSTTGPPPCLVKPPFSAQRNPDLACPLPLPYAKACL